MDNNIKLQLEANTTLTSIKPEEGKQCDNNEDLRELLSRVYSIRSAEKVAWEKMLEIFRTSIDFNPDPEEYFLPNMQNKMHFATHGRTAAEIICERADATQPCMGLKSWYNCHLGPPIIRDVYIGKNYLTYEELEKLYILVTYCLEFVEILAKKKIILSMLGWRNKINMLLSIAGYEVMPDNYHGSRSREEADKHAQEEYTKWISSQNFPIEDIDF